MMWSILSKAAQDVVNRGSQMLPNKPVVESNVHIIQLVYKINNDRDRRGFMTF